MMTVDKRDNMMKNAFQTRQIKNNKDRTDSRRHMIFWAKLMGPCVGLTVISLFWAKGLSWVWVESGKHTPPSENILQKAALLAADIMWSIITYAPIVITSLLTAAVAYLMFFHKENGTCLKQ